MELELGSHGLVFCHQGANLGVGGGYLLVHGRYGGFELLDAVFSEVLGIGVGVLWMDGSGAG